MADPSINGHDRYAAWRAEWADEDQSARDAIDEEDLHAQQAQASAQAADAFTFVAGGGFILDAPDTPPAIWGHGQHILWADGEALMIAGPQGTGKTTIGLQLLRARLGLADHVLGYRVAPGAKRGLWLAMDRPAQAARAARRLFLPGEREVLDQRLVVHRGPPPRDLAKHTDTLVRMAEQAGADTVLVDSLKDAAIGLTDDEVGASWNRARQKAIEAGVQVIELHHMIKSGGDGGKPNNINGVYGSVWLTAGTGSVILLWGEAGDPVVKLTHLKQPAEEVGPLWVAHDHAAGTSAVQHAADLVTLAARAPAGLTAPEAAKVLFEAAKPTRAQIEKARRQLDRLTADGLLIAGRGRSGGPGGGQPTTYHAATPDSDGGR